MKKLWCYDLESFPNLFALGFKCPKTGETKLFEISDRKNNSVAARRFLKEKVSKLVAFNSTSYDALLLDFFIKSKVRNAKKFNEISKTIIKGNAQHHNPIIPHLDLYKVLHFDNKNKRTSLKYCEFGLKMPLIQDLPFSFDKVLNRKQCGDVMKYLVNDLDATVNLFNEYKDKIYLRAVFTKKYGFNCLNWSDSKIGEKLLLKLYCNRTGEDIEYVSKLRTPMYKVKVKDILPDYLEFKNPELKKAYKEVSSVVLERANQKLKYVFYINNIKYVIGLGGIHASDAGVWKASDELFIDDQDVAGYYPSMLKNHEVCPEHLNKEAFLGVIDEELVKPRATIHKPKSKDKSLHWTERKKHAAFSDGLKLGANSVTGNLKNPFSYCYSPVQNMKMTLSGQFNLLMLIDMMWQYKKDIHVIQANTDGCTFTYHPKHKKEIDAIYKKWESITGLTLEENYPKAVYQRDVNNYIWDFGEYQKLKGAYEIDKKVGNELILNKDSSKKIVAIAAKEYFINGTPVKDTIKNHTDIYDFCIAKKAKKAPKKGHQYFEWQYKPGGVYKKIPNTKVLRYYVSTTGGLLWHRYYETDNRSVFEAGKSGKENKGHYWKLKMFNKYKEKTMEEYKIDYSYYIMEAQKLIDAIEKHVQPEKEI